MARLGLRTYLSVNLVISLFTLAMLLGGLWLTSHELTVLGQQTEEIVLTIGNVQALRTALSTHRRRLLEGALKNSDPELKALEVRIEERLERTKAGSTDPTEQELLKQEVAAVNSYLTEVRGDLANNVPPEAIYQNTAPEYLHLATIVHRLGARNAERAAILKQHAVGTATRVRNGTYFFLGLAAAAVVFAILLFNEAVRRPLLNLSTLIRRYAGGVSLPPDPPVALAEIVEISRTFRSLIEDQRRQNERQLTFLAAVAHDLRNPLAALDMSLQLDQMGPSSEAERQELQDVMRRQFKQLRRMIDDLLDTTRIEAGHFELKIKCHDLRDVIRDGVALFSSISEKHQLTLDLPDRALLAQFDADRLSQVLNNLLSNAIKYSPAGGPVRISAGLDREDVWLEVADQGIGISPTELPRLFEPFRRLSDQAIADIPGIGLGLSTVKKIVEAHRGRVSVTSQWGHGTVFRVQWPQSGPPVFEKPKVSVRTSTAMHSP